jgi:hypothetical protein
MYIDQPHILRDTVVFQKEVGGCEVRDRRSVVSNERVDVNSLDTGPKDRGLRFRATDHQLCEEGRNHGLTSA